MNEIKLGKYQHFKGRIMEVVGVAKHSETLEDMAVYKDLGDSEFGKDALWVRPSKMFFEEVEINGQKVPRFKYLG